MRIKRFSEKRFCLMNKLHSALWLIFKIGIPLGVGILVIGTLVSSWLFPQHFRNRVPQRVSSIAEVVMSLACLAMFVNCILEGYVSIQGVALSARSIINRLLMYIIAAIIFGGGAIVLGVYATQEWLNP